MFVKVGTIESNAKFRLRWMDGDLRLFSSISVISGRWVADNERFLCNGIPLLTIKKMPASGGLEPRTVRSSGQRLIYWASVRFSQEDWGKQ